MSKAGKRMIEGAKEALAIAKGEQPAASVTVDGFTYVMKPKAFEEAARIVYEWAKHEIINEGCRTDREPGCLSCDTIGFFEAIADELQNNEFRS